MKRKIKVVSLIDVLDDQHEFQGVIPHDEDFRLHAERMELSGEYDADYLDLGEYFELSYFEVEEEGEAPVKRILKYDKGATYLVVRREVNFIPDDSGKTPHSDIVIEKKVLHKNDYVIDGAGSLDLETFGLELEWGPSIHLVYLTNIAGLWSRVDMVIEFMGTVVCC